MKLTLFPLFLIMTTMSASATSTSLTIDSSIRRLGQTENKDFQRQLNYRDIKNRLIFERSIGLRGGTSSTRGMTTPARASTDQEQQKSIETITTKVHQHRPRSLQATRSMSFQEFCSTVEVSLGYFYGSKRRFGFVAHAFTLFVRN